MHKTASQMLAACALLLGVCSAGAVSLKPGNPTDDSVCDMTSGTSHHYQRKMPVAEPVLHNVLTELTYRLGGEWIAANCKPGQLLIMNEPARDGSSIEPLKRLASAVCRGADIKSQQMPVVNYRDEMVPGVEIRCVIERTEPLAKEIADKRAAVSDLSLRYQLIHEKPPGEAQVPRPTVQTNPLKSLIDGLTGADRPGCQTATTGTLNGTHPCARR